MIEISVLIPIYNEESNIIELYKRLVKVLKKITPNYEIVFVNDGSTDNSFKILKTISKKDKKTKIVSFSRNFGHMPAIDAGLDYVSGSRVVIMDADLQDPPEFIPKMLKKSIEGYDVVYGVKKKRKENAIKRFFFYLFYRVLNAVSEYSMPSEAGTFSIISKEVVQLLRKMPERNKYFSGLRAWTGFSQTGVVYERSARFSGKPTSFRRLVKLAFDGIFSFSYLPLRIASFTGFIFAAVAFVFIVIVLTARIFFQAGIIGWASTMTTILLIGGIQLITLGIIGEYLARIYDEVKRRPEYIIQEKINIK